MEKDVRELEFKRKLLLLWDVFFWTIMAACTVWAIYILFNDKTEFCIYWAFFAFAGPFAVLALFENVVGITLAREKYQSFYKHVFVERALKKRFTDVCYQLDWAISPERVEDSSLVFMGNQYIGMHYLGARYKGVLFEQANLLIRKRAGRKGGFSATYFNGRWMILKFPKPFKTELRIKEKEFPFIERITFDDLFKVKTKEDAEANKLLIADIREKIKWLADKYEGRVMVCFKERELHIAINSNKNAFQAPYYKKIVAEQAMQAVEEEIDMIIQFIEAFL